LPLKTDIIYGKFIGETFAGL